MKYIVFTICSLFFIIASANQRTKCVMDNELKKHCYKIETNDPEKYVKLVQKFRDSGEDDKKKLGAYKGYLLTNKEENYYPYFFNKNYTRNSFLLEQGFFNTRVFNSSSTFVQSTHNYNKEKGHLLYFKALRENREYSKENLTDYQIGAGIYYVLYPKLHNDFSLDFGINNHFLASFVVQNEIYFYKKENTFSLLGRLTSYSNSVGTSFYSFSPHYRRDFSFGYIGGRVNFYEQGNKTFTIYAGTALTYRLNLDGSYSFGETIEDGFLRSDFYSWSTFIKYKLKHNLDFSLKYVNSSYKRYYGKTEGFLVKILYRY